MESCKRTLDISIPVAEVEKETERVITRIQQRVRVPGFRPGKTPESLIRGRFQSEIRKDVLENLIPKFFKELAEQEGHKVVGTLGIRNVHFVEGEPVRFQAEFEVAPQFELQTYRGIQTTYREPEVNAADVGKRLEQVREQKAEYLNMDARPLADGDHAVVSLRSIAGVSGPPIEQDEVVLCLGDEGTMPEFSENLRGMSPGEGKEIEVAYPENYGEARLAGSQVRFHVRVKGLRRKELPEVNDEFAKDVGDFQTLEELREALRKTLLREREFLAQKSAKDEIVDRLIQMHDFPVPESYIDRQIEAMVEHRLRELAGPKADLSKVNLDWEEVRASMKDRATRDIKASLLLDRIADRESIDTTADELDREVHRIARQQREPAAAVRKRLEDDGNLRRIATRIRTDKTLALLFEHARKVAPEEADPSPEEAKG